MISRFLLLLASFAIAYAADAKKSPVTPAPAASSTGSVLTPTLSLDAFRLISDRNIFNANRTGRRDRSAEIPVARVDTITLVGTMDYDKGEYAFFDGSDADLRKALHAGQPIAQFTVATIARDSVELTRDGKTFKMSVGQQLRRPEGGDWTLVGADVARSETPAARPGDDATAAAPVPADASDIVRRMMEQRQKQLKQ
jgi:hypothetical protein